MNTGSSVNQKTLRQSIAYIGVGLHTGQKVSMRICPAEVNSGINIIRKDIPASKNRIKVRWYNVKVSQLSTVLGNSHGVRVTTVEHLLAALHGCGIDNATIELDGHEIPIMDGSAEPFVKMIEQAGSVDQQIERYAIWVHKPIEVRDGDKYAILFPAKSPRISVDIEFNNPVIGSQNLSIELNSNSFRKNISRARAFGFVKDITQLHNNGLALGGSLHNSVLVSDKKIVNKEGLRYQDEFVRHKILDYIGDLALLGVPVNAHIYARKPGHALTHKLMKKLFACRDAWYYTTVNDINNMTSNNRKTVYANFRRSRNTKRQVNVA